VLCKKPEKPEELLSAKSKDKDKKKEKADKEKGSQQASPDGSREVKHR